jgi:hypothetical protein
MTILQVTAKDRVHSYLGGGVDLPIGSGLLVKPSVMLRKVKGTTRNNRFYRNAKLAKPI